MPSSPKKGKYDAHNGGGGGKGGSDHEKFTPSVLNSLCKKDLLTYLHIFINIEVKTDVLHCKKNNYLFCNFMKFLVGYILVHNQTFGQRFC